MSPDTSSCRDPIQYRAKTPLPFKDEGAVSEHWVSGSRVQILDCSAENQSWGNLNKHTFPFVYYYLIACYFSHRWESSIFVQNVCESSLHPLSQGIDMQNRLGIVWTVAHLLVDSGSSVCRLGTRYRALVQQTLLLIECLGRAAWYHLHRPFCSLWVSCNRWNRQIVISSDEKGFTFD